MRRRNFLRTGVGIAGTVGLAGCMGGNKTPSQPTNTRETSSSDEKSGAGRANQQRVLQQSATIALEDNVTPGWADFWGGVSPYYTHSLEPLIWVSDDMSLIPWLASDWTATGKKTWEFSLREGVTFHNGKPLNADAVVFTFKESLEEFPWSSSSLQLKPEGVRKIDDLTVEFENTSPFPTFPGTIAHNTTVILHPDANREEGEVIGTGAFQVTDWKKNQYVQTKAFEDYWNEKPVLSKLRFRVIADANTRALALKGDEIDIAWGPPSSRVASLEQGENTKIDRRLTTFSSFAGFNLYKSPTDDVKLRQGINWAISQQLLVEEALSGIGVPARGPISKVIPWSAHEELPEYGPDLSKAKQLIGESSYNGESLTLIVNNTQTYGRLIAQVLQQALTDVGVTIEIQMLGGSAFADARRHGDAHIILTKTGSNSGAADYVLRGKFHSEGWANSYLYKKNGTGVYNLGGRVDELIEKGYHTGDPKVKERVYEKALQIIMQKGVVVPCHYVESVIGTRADMRGMDLRPIPPMVRWTGLKHVGME